MLYLKDVQKWTMLQQYGQVYSEKCIEKAQKINTVGSFEKNIVIRASKKNNNLATPKEHSAN